MKRAEGPTFARPGRRLTVAGLFSGIGGIEQGFHQAGHETALLCELDPAAARVLEHHFSASVAADVRELRSVGEVDVVTAGFPCQDLSQAGRTAGIGGRQSRLVEHVFRLLDRSRRGPSWLVLENVPFMLHLHRGSAMRHLVDELEARRFKWAYRVVDTRAFGLPQRRQRVLLVASRTEDPRTVLFADDVVPDEPQFSSDKWCGFYWTEGLRGLGWAVDAVPTLKGGSTIGIPSPPAIWIPAAGTFVTPDIRDVERLQGFEVDWTLPAVGAPGVRRSHRWKLIGNAVSVPVARWVGDRLAMPGSFDPDIIGDPLPRVASWPKAACGENGRVHPVRVSAWPVRRPTPHLSKFIRYPMVPLSERAAAGFKSRMDVSTLEFERSFRIAMRRYVERGSRVVA
jgi:DNA (cytosine-5)-methyltransferase 1